MIREVTIDHEIDQLNAGLAEYRRESGKTTSEVLAKKGTDFSFQLSRRLSGLAPGKGAIRAERLAALKQGGGVKVRESVRKSISQKYGVATRISDRTTVLGRYKSLRKTATSKGKRLNIRALMVQRELSLREQGIGYLGFAARMNVSRFRAGSGTLQKYGRYRQLLGAAGLRVVEDDQELKFEWGGGRTEIAEGLSTPDAQQEIAGAVRDVTNDMAVYLERKQAERIERALKKFLR